MKSIVYAHPYIYSLAIRFLYFDGLKILRDIIGPQKSVFEPACGYGRIKRYIYPSCNYSGIDLNENFVDYGRKKKRDIQLGNILDIKHYKNCDVIVLSDILHHLTLKDITELLSIAVQFAREKIVIVEPEFITMASHKNIFSRMLARIMSFMDYDGINEIKKWLSEDEYNSLFQSLKENHNLSGMKVKKFRKHFFVEMFLKNESPPPPTALQS